MSAERWVREFWSGGHGLTGAALRTALLPVEWAFRALGGLRSASFSAGLLPATRAEIPVIGVGNLSVGGTGKTPMASWVLRTLLDAGHRPALVARGYGADELELHRSWLPDVAVFANVDRVRAVAEAAASGADVAVLDDGFQHRRLARELDLVLIAAEQGIAGPLLPRGPFREPPRALNRAGAVVVTRKSASDEVAQELELRAAAYAPMAVRARVRFVPADVIDLFGDPTEVPERARIVTAVAGPEGVVAGAESLGVEVESLVDFPDHHDFTAGDVREALSGWEGPVVVTEKDAVKLRALREARTADVRVLRQRVDFESGEEALRERVLHAVRPIPGARR